MEELDENRKKRSKEERNKEDTKKGLKRCGVAFRIKVFAKTLHIKSESNGILCFP